jgi:hypothetical protein
MNVYLLYISRAPNIPGTIVGVFSTLEKATDEANRLWALAYDTPPLWTMEGALRQHNGRLGTNHHCR